MTLHVSAVPVPLPPRFRDFLKKIGYTVKYFYSRPGRVWLVTSLLGTGKTIIFFYCVFFKSVLSPDPWCKTYTELQIDLLMLSSLNSWLFRMWSGKAPSTCGGCMTTGVSPSYSPTFSLPGSSSLPSFFPTSICNSPDGSSFEGLYWYIPDPNRPFKPVITYDPTQKLGLLRKRSAPARLSYASSYVINDELLLINI